MTEKITGKRGAQEEKKRIKKKKEFNAAVVICNMNRSPDEKVSRSQCLSVSVCKDLTKCTDFSVLASKLSCILKAQHSLSNVSYGIYMTYAQQPNKTQMLQPLLFKSENTSDKCSKVCEN